MKSVWLHCVRLYLRIGLFFYFRRINIYGLDNIPKNKAVLLLSNHQNALLDALLIATQFDRFGYFLTRAGVFKKTFISKLLNSLNMLPVYRIRDGWSNLTNNNSIFEKVTELLHQNKTVVIFPEGSHNLARRVRPLSKGFTRIVFDTFEKYPDTELSIVPIGLNFRNAKDFVDSAAMYVGQPLNARTYITDHKNDGVVDLKNDVHQAISELTTDIPLENYDDSLNSLEALHVDFLDPKSVNHCIANNFDSCTPKSKSKLNWLRSLLKIILIITILPPYLIWKYVAQPKIKEIEFTSTFRFAIAITLVPLYLIILTMILSTILGIETALLVTVAIVLLALITVKL